MTIYFDMDGTIAGLFFVKDFSKKLNEGDMTPYIQARALYNADEMEIVINQRLIILRHHLRKYLRR